MAEEEMTDELEELISLCPTPDDLKDIHLVGVENWADRDGLIAEIRIATAGDNKVLVPKEVLFKSEEAHEFLFLAQEEEKTSRFLERPRYDVIPFSDSLPERSEAEQIEQALNAGEYWQERRDKANTWSRLKRDLVSFYGAVERVEWAPATFWPDLIPDETGRDRLSYLIGDDEEKYKQAREEYKKEMGWPIRNVRVALDDYFPSYRGSKLLHATEIELMTWRDVKSRGQFWNRELLPDPGGIRDQLTTQVPIVHFVDDIIHAYYALVPGKNRSGNMRSIWPDGRSSKDVNIGTPVLLYAYKHRLGKPIYNEMGAWPTQDAGDAVARLKGMLHLNQAADNLATQVATVVRAFGYPTHVAYMSENRPDATDGPKAPNIPEGGTLPMMKDERLEILDRPNSVPMASERRANIIDRFQFLAGARSLYGQRDEGVATGYQQNLLLTQAQHLDSVAENYLITGAINRAQMVLEYARAYDETIYAVGVQVGEWTGNKKANYFRIDPKKVKTIPMLEARVRAPSQVNFTTDLQNALSASQEREGKGPLLDDETIREKVMGIDNPQQVKRRIILEKWEKQLENEPRIMDLVIQRLIPEIVSEETPAIAPTDANIVPPALMQATSAINSSGETEGMGGVDPAFLQQQLEGMYNAGQPLPPRGMGSSNQGRGGGPAPGAPQMPQVLGVNGPMSGAPMV